VNCGRWRGLGVAGWVVSLAPALLAPALLAPALAAAPPLEWEAPERCPSAQAANEKLREALGHEASELGSVSRVRGVIVAESVGYRLTLEVVDAGRRSLRSFHAERCEDLAGAAALAIALAVHPAAAANDGATGAPGSAESAVEEVPVAPRAEEMAGDRGDAELTASSGSWTPSWSAGASGVLDVGALPDPALGVGVEVRAALGRLELDVHGLLLPRQRRPVGDAESVELGLMAAGLRACVRLLEDGLVVGACLGGEAGRFTATGVGLEPGREARDVWLAIGPALFGRTAFAGPLQLELWAEPLLPLARKQYAVNETQLVHSPSVVDLRVQVGLVIGASAQAERR
jgi:hypothetical protein